MLASTGALPLTLIGEALFEGVDSFALIAIPLFILTGDVMVRSGLAYRLLDFAESTFGTFRAGFGTSTVMGCGLFSCISGSDAADAAAIGRITMDRLQEKGYPKAYACALVASGACTGILIPPSIAYIIIGLVLGISSATLFQAAFVPGVMVLVAVMLTNALDQPGSRLRAFDRQLLVDALVGGTQRREMGTVDPGDHPRRDLLGYLHPDRGGGGRGRDRRSRSA